MREEMDKLRKELELHDDAYYNKDAPTITDYEYDMLLRRLAALEAQYPEYAEPDSPTRRLDAKPDNAFAPVPHPVLLLSLQNAYSFEELDVFDQRLRENLDAPVPYIAEPKVDGLSVALWYRDGRFIQGATRGDGRTGEDVTHNLRTIEALPARLNENAPAHLIVRGEVFMPVATWHELNVIREEEGLPLLANPRNAAAGSLRQLDSAVAAQRRLSILIFDILQMSDPMPAQGDECLALLESWGFPVIDFTLCGSMEDVKKETERLSEQRHALPFEMDGMVVNANSFTQRNALGSTAKFPRWAIAYKYPPDIRETELLEIVTAVGRTGVLTPRAVLAPVRLAGTTVTSATLHNEDFIRSKDIRTGDIVRVRKAGDRTASRLHDRKG